MVLQKRLDYGSRGCQIPAMPCVPSSARRKRSTRRKSNEMHAFDLLATVAGTLLADQGNLSNVPDINGAAANYAMDRNLLKQKQFDEAPPPGDPTLEKDSCNGCTARSGVDCTFPRQANICSAENLSTRNEVDLGSKSLTAKPNVLFKDSVVSCTKSGVFGPGLGTIPEDGAFGLSHPGSTRSVEDKQEQQAGRQTIKSNTDDNAAALYSLVGVMDSDAKPPALVSSDSSSGAPLYSHNNHHNSFPLFWGRMQHAADRDDDENSSGCTHHSTAATKGYMPHCVGDRRMRRLFASKLRKAARHRTSREISNKDTKPGFCGRKISTTRQRVQRTTFKRKGLARRNFTVSSDKGLFTEASGTSFSMEGPNRLYGSEDYRVKLSIKSFDIQELLIEIPENATIGSLKNTVMDAVTAIIERGLRVGVLLQGKNIHDDNKTLRQAGICHGEKLDTIGFALESEATQAPSPEVIVPEDANFLDAGDIVEPLARIKSEEPFCENRNGDGNAYPMPASPNCLVSDPGSVHSPAEVMAQEPSANSQAIVAVPPVNVEALSIVPLCKSKQSDIGQRRIRRPFSVAEVEALVQAVEQLGTGRWRDVKIRAFDNTNHRTYVDLKDKWKTLVHTASISPQQRRGQPVPQELLDRVLSVQAYWSQNQAKLQDKPPVPEVCLA